MTRLLLLLLLASVEQSSTKSSSHWRLIRDDQGHEVIRPNVTNHPEVNDLEIEILTILTTTQLLAGGWTKTATQTTKHCPICAHDDDVDLDCGKPANFTYYDQLVGVATRASLPDKPEAAVAQLFKKKSSRRDLDLPLLERKLKRAKAEKPSSVQLYNQIGNYWRIKGSTLRAIECFRRALSLTPNNPEVLHNLARLLLHLNFLDDALFLARRSLELQSPDKQAWSQHFTLGQILKKYGHQQEALLHFKQCLEIKPDHEGALDGIKDLESMLGGTGLQICTCIIIIFLVLGVLVALMSNLDLETGFGWDTNKERKGPSRFSRALQLSKLRNR